MRYVLGAVAAALMVGAVFAQPAEARCFFNGFETVCVHHSWHPWHRHFYGGGFYRPYWWGGY